MAVRTLLTAEQLLEISTDTRAELVKGELVEMVPPGIQHGKIVSTLNIIVGSYVRTNKLGHTYSGEPGIILSRQPDTLRAPDFMFVAAARLPAEGEPAGYWELAPDLVVEVVSPNDRWDEVESKVDEYLIAGVRMVWVVNPKTRSVHVYRPSRDVKRILENDMIDGEDVLPGFTVEVKEVFEYQA